MQTTLIIEETKALPPEIVNDLQASFEPLFKNAQMWKANAEKIKVTDINDKASMQAAREARLHLKNIRVEANEVRVRLKEESLLKGKAIDGMFNVIKYLIQPIETQLEEQEKFAELQEEKRLNALVEDRMKKLTVYVDDLSIFNLRVMSDEQFEGLLQNAEKAHEVRLATEKQAEQERFAKEKAEKEEQERIRKENEKLRQEAEEREIQIAAEKKAQADKEAKEKAERDAKAKAEREAQELKLRHERETREKLEAELKAKEQAEEKARIELENKAKEAKLAPDKDKLRKLAQDLLSTEYPEMHSEEAKKVLAGVQELMQKVNIYIIRNIDSI